MTACFDTLAPEPIYLQSPDDLRLHVMCWRGPQDAPDILLVHGFMHHAFVWSHLAQRLRQHFNVYALDFRGHGDSQWDAQQRYRHDDLQNDIRCAIDSLHLRGCHLIGHSLGARVAALLLAQQPQLARSFTLIDTGPDVGAAGVAKVRKDAETQPQVFASVEFYFDYLRKIYALANRDALAAFARHSLRQQGDNFALKTDPAFTRALWNPASYHNDSRDLRAPLNDQLWTALGKLTMPVLVMRGAASAILSQKTADRMLHVIPRAELKTVAMAGHAVMLDNPNDTTTLIEDFLQRVKQQ